MFEINLTLVIFIVSFLVFLTLLDSLFLKPVGEVIETRNKRIKDDQESGLQFQAEAQSKLDNYEKKLSSLREEAQKVIAEAVEEAQTKRNARLAALKDNTRRRLEEERAKLSAEKPALTEALVEHEKELVHLIVSRALGSERPVTLIPGQVKLALEEAR